MTRRGTEAAVMVPIEEWRRLTSAARPRLKDLLLADERRFDDLILPRGRFRRRKPTEVA